MNGRLFNIQRFCTDDGPGIRTTVFLKGCPLRCIWCHNPESQSSDFELDYGYFATAEEVFSEILRDKIFYETSGGGVTLSGGEPLYQPEFSASLLSLCRESRIHTAIETCGFASEKDFISVVSLCDLVLFDVKETDEKRHKEYTGSPLEPILENLKTLDRLGIPSVIRAPIIPTLNDRPSHFAAIRELRDSLEHCQGIEIMPYHRTGADKYRTLGKEYLCEHINAPTDAEVERWRKLI